MSTALAREELCRAAVGRPTALTLGIFDGVHRGHQALMQRLIESAARAGLASGVVTLHPHPRQVINPAVAIQYITSLEDRLDLLRGLGLQCVAPVTFTSELAQTDAASFVRLLVDHLQMQHLVIGPDFALGRRRGGDPQALATLGDELGFTVEVIDLLEAADAKVSSTDIRAALAAGSMDSVNALLGRRFSLHGPVVHGLERGRTIGFPTANIAVGADRALPATGVYATVAHVAETRLPSVTNIGVRPTFDDDSAITIRMPSLRLRCQSLRARPPHRVRRSPAWRAQVRQRRRAGGADAARFGRGPRGAGRVSAADDTALEAEVARQHALIMRGTAFGDVETRATMERELRERLAISIREQRPLRVYLGVDPTAPDLHLGHVVGLRKLRTFSDLGHQAILLNR